MNNKINIQHAVDFIFRSINNVDYTTLKKEYYLTYPLSQSLDNKSFLTAYQLVKGDK